MILPWLISQGIGSFAMGIGKKWFDSYLEERKLESALRREKERLSWGREETQRNYEPPVISESCNHTLDTDHNQSEDSILLEREKAFYKYLEQVQSPIDAHVRKVITYFIMFLVCSIWTYIGYAFFILSIQGNSQDKTINGLLVNFVYFAMFLAVTVIGFYFGYKTSSEIIKAFNSHAKR